MNVVTAKRHYRYHGITASYLPSPRYYRESFPIPAVITVVTAVSPLSPLPCHLLNMHVKQKNSKAVLLSLVPDRDGDRDCTKSCVCNRFPTRLLRQIVCAPILLSQAMVFILKACRVNWVSVSPQGFGRCGMQSEICREVTPSEIRLMRKCPEGPFS